MDEGISFAHVIECTIFVDGRSEADSLLELLAPRRVSIRDKVF